MEKLINIKRGNTVTGLIGGMSKGKSLFEAYCGYMMHLNNYIVFSNMPLNYPHVFIDSIDDIFNIRNDFDINQKKYMILDDGELWFSSRNWQKNKLSELTIFFGKINTSVIWSTKRGNIDIDLRDVTGEFYLVDMYQYKNFERIDINGNPYMNDCLICLDGFSSDGEDLGKKYLLNLHIWCKLYSTQHMLEKIKTQSDQKNKRGVAVGV